MRGLSPLKAQHKHTLLSGALINSHLDQMVIRLMLALIHIDKSDSDQLKPLLLSFVYQIVKRSFGPMRVYVFENYRAYFLEIPHLLDLDCTDALSLFRNVSRKSRGSEEPFPVFKGVWLWV